MKYITVIVFMLMSTVLIAQEDKSNKLLVANPLVKEVLNEYINEAEVRGIVVSDLLNDKLEFILVESNLKHEDDQRQLCGKNISMLDLDKKLILLSEVCLVDYTLLKSELFKQLSFCLGVKPTGQNTIISNEFTDKYTNAYLTDAELRKEEYDFMYAELRKVINSSE